MCINPITISNPRKDFDARFDAYKLRVPCNHCWQCLQMRQYDYEKRAISEFQNIFNLGGSVWNYTLTYHDKYVPKYLGVNVLMRSDIQNFKKKLKRIFKERGEQLDVMYAGEYGHSKDRPHWHILIFCKFPFDAQEMYIQVKRAWTVCVGKGKHMSVHEMRGYVGLPIKWDNGKPLPVRSINALLDNVHAIKYCIKYVFKSYNFRNSLMAQFKRSLILNYGLDETEINNFVFPKDKRFHFPDKKLDIKVISQFFSSCYRSPNYFGMSQQKFLDENYITQTTFFVEKDGSKVPMSFSISKYLKNKLFHINCVSDNEIVCSRYSNFWLQYMLKNIFLFADNKSNYYICNSFVPIYCDSANDNPNFHYVEDVLNYISTYICDNLRSFFLYNCTYLNKPFLSDKTIPFALACLQSRKLDSYSVLDDEIHTYNELINYILPYLTLCDQSIAYEKYKENIKNYNDRQDLISFELHTMPKKMDILPFSKFINLKSISLADEKKNF